MGVGWIWARTCCRNLFTPSITHDPLCLIHVSWCLASLITHSYSHLHHTRAPTVHSGGVCTQTVLVRLADSDRNGIITRSELRALQLLAEQFAAAEALDVPRSLPDLLDALYLGFDREELRREAAMWAAAPDASCADADAETVEVGKKPSSATHGTTLARVLAALDVSCRVAAPYCAACRLLVPCLYK